MLTDVGILKAGENAQEDAAFEHLFRNVWADNADVVSKSYSGTGALKTDFTRTGNRTRAGALQDLNNSITRYVCNNFLDGPRQDAFDLFLGTYTPDPSGLGSAHQFADTRPVLIQSLPYILAACVFFIFISLFTRRLPDATVWPLRIFVLLCLVGAAWSGRFITSHGGLYVSYCAETVVETKLINHRSTGQNSTHLHTLWRVIKKLWSVWVEILFLDPWLPSTVAERAMLDLDTWRKARSVENRCCLGRTD